MSRWWPALAVPLAGILASFALPPIHILPLLVTLSYPIARMLACQNMRSAFWVGWGCGLGWFLVSLYWISNAMLTGGEQFYWMIPFAMLLLPSFLAIFWGLAFALAWRSGSSLTLRWGVLIFWLMIMEWLRAHLFTGFPWQTPGMVFAFRPLGFDLASVIGVFGCGVVAIMLASLPLAIRLNKRLGLTVVAMLSGLTVMAILVSGRPLIDHAASGLTVRMVQPAIPQQDKWKSELKDQHLAMHLEQSYALSEDQSKPDLIVWGEVSYAGFLEHDWQDIETVMLKATAGTSWVLLGGLRQQKTSDRMDYYNSIFLVQPDAKISGVYDKRYLVPWGEYVPFREAFSFVDHLAGGIDFSAGVNAGMLTLKRPDGRIVNIAPLICYEVIFPVSTRHAAIGADMLVNLTNDAWFGDSLGPRQHLAMAQMRSAELGLPMVRVATTGISAIINAYGQVTSHITYNTSDWQDIVISGRTHTIYARYGELGFVVLLIFCLGAGIGCRRQNSLS
ncbi:MAG: apolipoprotein N-acyltransferase [Pseudomonadota bacterium]|nr:apolipoprotein N-acyltransferase [Pseudomonadota bacterium]